jgi:hypothetical protein
MIVTIILDVDGVSHVCRTFEDESIQINKIVSSVDNLGSQGTVTKQSFRLPLTGGLLDAIGDVTDPSQSAKVNLNKSIKGRILVDGFERFVGSFFVVNATSGDSKEVEMIFQGSETDLKAVLSNMTMAELYEGESVLYNYTELKQYFDNPETYRDNTGYVFPLINFGQNWVATDFSYSGLTEYDFKVATTFKKAFELMPFNITTNGIDDLMNQVIVLHNEKEKSPALDTTDLSYTGGMNGIYTFAFANDVTPKTIPFSSVDAYIDPNIFDLSTNEYIVQVGGTHTFNYYASTLIREASSNVKNFQFFIRVKRGGTVVSDTGGFWGSVEFTGITTNERRFSVNDEMTLHNLQLGDRVSLLIISYSDAVFIDGRTFNCISAPSFFPNSRVNISANCPDLTAWDIFRTIAIQCNAQIIANPNGTFELTPYVDWIEENQNSSDVIIVDDLIEDEIDVQVRPFSVQGAKSIRLSYKENSDYLSTKYKELTDNPFGEKYIDNTGTELAKNELKIELPVATIPHNSLDVTSAPIPSFTDKDGKLIVGAPTILNTSSATCPLSWKLKSVFSTNFTVYSSIPYTGNWETVTGGYSQTDSNFGQSLSYHSSVNYPKYNLYQRFWKDYLEETYSEQSREIKMNIKLNRNQIDGLKFNEKFYYKNTLLRLIKLEGVSLTSNQPATATFMKRFKIRPIEIAEYYPDDIINSIVQWKSSSSNNPLTPPDGSNANPTALEASAKAYGFFYDADNVRATQKGQILIS